MASTEDAPEIGHPTTRYVLVLIGTVDQGCAMPSVPCVFACFVEQKNAHLRYPHLPPTRLMTHILLKGTQVGAVLGFATVVPLSAYQVLYKGVALSALPPTILKTTSRFLLGGFAATAALGAARVSQLDADGIYDRAYRLKYNKGQNRTDLFANCAGAVGAGAAAAALGVNLTNVGGGASLGIVAGLLLHLATMPKAERTGGNAMIEEAKTLLDE